MYVSNQLVDFLQFIVVGAVISCIFDFFRGYRKLRKTNNLSVLIQDIIFFVIITVIIVLSIINFLSTQLRLYIFIGIIIGSSIYFSLFSKYFFKIFTILIEKIKSFFWFFILPLNLLFNFLKKICRKIVKFIKKCCKLFLNVVLYICNLLKKIKRGRINEKKGKNKRKKKNKV